MRKEALYMVTTFTIHTLYGWILRDHCLFLQYDDGERYQHFKQFFDDTLPEFTKAGKVVQFKVRTIRS